MAQQINETLPELLQSLRTIAENGDYREKDELIPVLRELSWFDNFSDTFSDRRTDLLEELEDEVRL